jgi:hypothetical protein
MLFKLFKLHIYNDYYHDIDNDNDDVVVVVHVPLNLAYLIKITPESKLLTT